MDVTRAVVGTMGNNAYLLVDAGEGLLIDAAADPAALLALIGGIPVATIVTTHRHRDHLLALASLAEHTGARLVAGEPDAEAIEQAAGVTIDQRVWDGDTLRVGSADLAVVGLVGHTPGSIALIHRPEHGPARVFSGDALFPGGPGKVIRSEDFDSLMADLENKVFDRYPDDTVVHPGHGDPTTLGHERPHLPEWWARRW